MIPAGENARRVFRRPSVTSFAFCVAPDCQTVQIGVTSNISYFGACIFSDCWCKEGDILEIVSSLSVPHSKAEVRWIKKDAADLYVMGLRFVE